MPPAERWGLCIWCFSIFVSFHTCRAFFLQIRRILTNKNSFITSSSKKKRWLTNCEHGLKTTCALSTINIQPQPAETSSRGNYETSKPAFNLAMNCRRNCASLNELRSPLRATLSFLAKLFPRHKPTECSWTCTRPDLQEGTSWHQNIEHNLAWLAWLKNYKPVEIVCLQKRFFVFISRLEDLDNFDNVIWMQAN